MDTGTNNGNMYAELFAPDGAFLDRAGKATKGRDARGGRGAPVHAGAAVAVPFPHEPRHRGDAGWGERQGVPAAAADGGARHENDIFGGGHYEDTYRKTANGWRFKTRQFIPSDLPAAGAAAATPPTSG